MGCGFDETRSYRVLVMMRANESHFGLSMGKMFDDLFPPNPASTTFSDTKGVLSENSRCDFVDKSKLRHEMNIYIYSSGNPIIQQFR